jgi:hypothetical protein
MRNLQLECVPSWRFCNIKNGEKIPFDNGWQKSPRTLQDIWSDNVGVMLGSASHGLCAIDFDGENAIDHFNKTFPNIDITSLDTVMWTSGKPYRFQAAFNVPREYWIVLKRKVVNNLELRWAGCQSVVPPSKLNDGREYFWLKSPDKYPVMDIPEEILVYWLQLIYNDVTKYDDVTDYQHDSTDRYDVEFVDELLKNVNLYVGNLRGDYDVWRTIAWATCSEVGMMEAKMLMLRYWPDKTRKEMKTLTSWKPRTDTPKIGTLIKLSKLSKEHIKDMELEFRMRKLKNNGIQRSKSFIKRQQEYKQELDDIKLLREVIEERKHGSNK